jgi:uncharacterized hydrophobic protein (TIGR00341 family)
MKIIEVIADAGHEDTIRGIAEQHLIEDLWFSAVNEDGRIAARMLVRPEHRQAVLDVLQTILSSSENARILIHPIEASLPRPKESEEDETAKRKKSTIITREEIFSQVEKGAQLSRNYLILIALSAVVSSIGLLEDNVAVIIGAMVIAPLLGPNIAFALGTTMGDSKLIIQALKALAAGLAVAVLVAIGIGYVWPDLLYSSEVLARTNVTFSGASIALASGAAGALSLVTSVSGVLVGVMVAVALMPPATTIGLMLSTGDYQAAFGATLLLAMNIACINLSAKIVFLSNGIRPRTWLETRKANQSRALSIIFWISLLLVIALTIYFREHV